MTGIKKTDDNTPVELNFDALYNNLPLTAEKMDKSITLEQSALFELGKLYVERIEDCNAAIETYERLRTEHTGYGKMDEILFHLYYCYRKSGELDKAEAIKKQMQQQYPEGRFTAIALTGKDPESKTQSPAATKTYEQIYDLFIEGRFGEALQQKTVADSLYGKNYWTPQLLYIEAVYYIKQRQDSLATQTLRNIMSEYPGELLAARAENLIEVLSRRQQIEQELTKLQVERPVESNNAVAFTDSTQKQPIQQPISNQVITDTTNKGKVLTKPPSDTSGSKTVGPVSSAFFHSPNAQHFAVILLNKVDAVFGREAQNAFSRYNREKYNTQQIPLNTTELDGENKLLLAGPFSDAQAALEYVQKAKPLAPREIIPWLKADKYSFFIITANNLELLKTKPDLPSYKKFLSEYYPGIF